MTGPMTSAGQMSQQTSPPDKHSHQMSGEGRVVREPGEQDSGVSVFGLADLLWPHPAVVTLERAGGQAEPAVAQYIPLPSATDPRLLLPRRPRRAAAAAIRHQPAAPGKARLRRDIGALGIAGGLGDFAQRHHIRVVAGAPVGGAAETVETFFSRRLGREVLLSMHLGKPRANRKPVVQILTPTGTTLGFAKIGVDALTNSLVRAETSALHLIAAAHLRQVTTAEVLFSDCWNDLDIVMTSPLPVWGRRRAVPADVLLAATQEVAAVAPASTLTLRDWMGTSGLLDRLAGLAPGEAASDLRSAAADLVAAAGHIRLDCGAWHGDWTPWNMAAVADRLFVWDWERFAAPVPKGFDALHHSLQQALVSERRPARAATEALTRGAPATLAPYDVPPDIAPVVVLAYLTELAGRYLHDGQEAAGARLGRVGEWLVPVLATLAADL